MSVKLNLWGKANQEDKLVSGDFGTFFVTLRRPTAAERVRMRGLLWENNIQDLLLLRLQLLVGWKDLFDTDGKPIPFNDHNKDAVFAEQSILDATLQAIRDFVEEKPLEDASAKKSETLPDSSAQ